MFITIHVKPNKRKEGVEKISDTEFVIYTKKPATEGKANEDVIKQLAKCLKILRSEIHIVRGITSKKKVVKIGI